MKRSKFAIVAIVLAVVCIAAIVIPSHAEPILGDKRCSGQWEFIGKRTAVKYLYVSSIMPYTTGETFALTGALALTGDLTLTGAMDISDSITLENDEIIDNATDGTVGITFDDRVGAATNQLGVVKRDSSVAAGTVAAGDDFLEDWSAYNDATQKVTFARVVVDLTDETDGTEDGTHEVWVQAAGTLTKICSVDASGVTAVGDVSGTTIGGITEANLVDKSASETIAGAWTFTSTPNLTNAVSGTFTNSAGDSLTILHGVITSID